MGKRPSTIPFDVHTPADLSNVEYMPAYINKRLNNRLWSRRKAMQAVM